jgi:hypothetical protein
VRASVLGCEALAHGRQHAYVRVPLFHVPFEQALEGDKCQAGITAAVNCTDLIATKFANSPLSGAYLGNVDDCCVVSPHDY